MQTKKCNKCGIVKPISEFSKNKNKKDGYDSWCKSCKKEYHKQYYKNNVGKIKEQHKQYYKQYYADNSKKLKECSKQYYKDNIEKIKEKDKQYYKNNADKIKGKVKQYRVNNSEKIKKYKKQHYLNNPEKMKGYIHRRRALLLMAKADNIDFLQICENYNWRCGICGKRINRNLKWPDPMSLSLDHIIPLSKGGNHIASNIQPVHLKCNLIKCNNISNIQLKLI